MKRCFACDRRVRNPYHCNTEDGQVVRIGAECWKQVKAAGSDGWQPENGGPRIFLLTSENFKRLMNGEVIP